MRRNPRVFHELFHDHQRRHGDRAQVGAPVLLGRRDSAGAGRDRAWRGAGARGLPLSKSRFGDERSACRCPRIEAPAVLDLGSIELDVPDCGEPALRRIAFRAARARRDAVAQNHLDVAIHPRARRSAVHARQLVWSADEDIRERFGALGYGARAPSTNRRSSCRATTTRPIADHVRQGASLLLLPEEEMVLYPFFPHWQNVRVQPRDGHALARRLGLVLRVAAAARATSRAFRAVRSSTRPWIGCCPIYVISGCNLLDFQARVFAGLVVGWIHKPVALGVERSYGRGRLVATTFRLFAGRAAAPTRPRPCSRTPLWSSPSRRARRGSRRPCGRPKRRREAGPREAGGLGNCPRWSRTVPRVQLRGSTFPPIASRLGVSARLLLAHATTYNRFRRSRHHDAQDHRSRRRSGRDLPPRDFRPRPGRGPAGHRRRSVRDRRQSPEGARERGEGGLRQGHVHPERRSRDAVQGAAISPRPFRSRRGSRWAAAIPTSRTRSSPPRAASPCASPIPARRSGPPPDFGSGLRVRTPQQLLEGISPCGCRARTGSRTRRRSRRSWPPTPKRPGRRRGSTRARFRRASPAWITGPCTPIR